MLLRRDIYRKEISIPFLKMVEEFLYPPEGFQPRFCYALDTRGFCEILTDLLRHCEERFNFVETFFHPTCRRPILLLTNGIQSPAIFFTRHAVYHDWFHEWVSAHLREFHEMTDRRDDVSICWMLMNSFEARMGPIPRRRWLETVEVLVHNRLISPSCGTDLSDMFYSLILYLCRMDYVYHRI